ncbi:unnamed protein product [Brachionus calyciflorus]|uniref:Uncharacterized protein n=1 Tax=Brachionus calyciflorus TaxID=104777 RepID=A0A814H1M6_9BILA|nr:unnamed protein product [Brachionus calyciflorus]
MKLVLLAVLLLSVSINADVGVVGRKSDRVRALSRAVQGRTNNLSASQSNQGQFEFVPIQRMTPPVIAQSNDQQSQFNFQQQQGRSSVQQANPVQQAGPSQREQQLLQQQIAQQQALIAQGQRSTVQPQLQQVQPQLQQVQPQLQPVQPQFQQVQPQVRPVQPQQQQVQQQVQPQFPSVRQQGDEFCRNAQPGDIVPHPQFPSQFVICYGFGEFTVMDCPQHLVYNPHLQRCDLHLEEPQMCASNPCQNNGKCVELGSAFRCECPVGFAGQVCERQDSCTARPCGGDGFCLPMQQGSPVGHVCICNGGRTFGQTCAQAESNPCLTPGANMRMFPTSLGAQVFAHCEGARPHFKFCQAPLVFSPSKQSCDWL